VRLQVAWSEMLGAAVAAKVEPRYVPRAACDPDLVERYAADTRGGRLTAGV
jgi:hypothetical protein